MKMYNITRDNTSEDKAHTPFRYGWSENEDISSGLDK